MGSQVRSVLFSITLLGVCLVPSQVVVSGANANPPQENTQDQEITQDSLPIGRVGQINPSEPIRITIVNDTRIDLYTGFYSGAKIELPRTARTTFAFSSTPVNVFAYPAIEKAILKFTPIIEGNTVTVQITEVNGDTFGNEAINIKLSGEVYVY